MGDEDWLERLKDPKQKFLLSIGDYVWSGLIDFFDVPPQPSDGTWSGTFRRWALKWTFLGAEGKLPVPTDPQVKKDYGITFMTMPKLSFIKKHSISSFFQKEPASHGVSREFLESYFVLEQRRLEKSLKEQTQPNPQHAVGSVEWAKDIICDHALKKQLLELITETSVVRSVVASSDRPTNSLDESELELVESVCRSCRNTGYKHDFTGKAPGRICGCQAGEKLRASSNRRLVTKTRASSNRPTKPQAKCRSCGNTGKDFLGRICGCQAGEKLRASSNRPTKPQAKCRSCGNTGKDFLGRICGCLLPLMEEIDQAKPDRRRLGMFDWLFGPAEEPELEPIEDSPTNSLDETELGSWDEYEYLCRGCGNTGKDFLGRICGCQAEETLFEETICRGCGNTGKPLSSFVTGESFCGCPAGEKLRASWKRLNKLEKIQFVQDLHCK